MRKESRPDAEVPEPSDWHDGSIYEYCLTNEARKEYIGFDPSVSDMARMTAELSKMSKDQEQILLHGSKREIPRVIKKAMKRCNDT